MPISLQDESPGCAGFLAAHWLGTGFFVLLIWATSHGEMSVGWLALTLISAPIIAPLFALGMLFARHDAYIFGDLSGLGFGMLLLWPFVDLFCYWAADRWGQGKRTFGCVLIGLAAMTLIVAWVLS